jgi:hypothetical protein
MSKLRWCRNVERHQAQNVISAPKSFTMLRLARRLNIERFGRHVISRERILRFGQSSDTKPYKNNTTG